MCVFERDRYNRERDGVCVCLREIYIIEREMVCVCVCLVSCTPPTEFGWRQDTHTQVVRSSQRIE